MTAPTTYDLLIRGGRVIDPANDIDDVRDVAISRGRIAAVDAELPTESARRTIDARGLLVLPGLVDLHAHVYRRFTFISVDADAIRTLKRRHHLDRCRHCRRTHIRRPTRRRNQARSGADLRAAEHLEHRTRWVELGVVDYRVLRRRPLRSSRRAESGRDRRSEVRMGTPTVGANGLEPLRRASRRPRTPDSHSWSTLHTPRRR